jgi:DNA-binding beta-propeller fold protein YncE
MGTSGKRCWVGRCRLTGAALGALVLGGLGTSAASSPGRAASAGAGVAFARVDLNPQAVAVYLAKNTIYSANNARNDISVVNGARCNAATTTGCARLPPRQDVGEVPSAIAVNQRTKTVYVVNNTETAHGSVSVVNAARCNATDVSRCTHYPHLPPSVRLPFSPNDIAINERTNTIYVDGGDHQLAVIDGRSCNGGDARGCRRAPHIGRVAAGAGAVAVNTRTNTVYVVDYFSGLVSVLGGRTCDGRDTSGCSRRRAVVRVGRHPWRLTVDAASNTLYVTNLGARSVSVIDLGRCNATVTSGCRRRPPVIRVGFEPEAVAVDDRNHVAFVTNAGDNTVSIFDASTCDAADTSGCGQRPATKRVGRLPAGIVINQRTGTVYVADNGGHTLAVIRSVLPPG